MKYHFYTDNKRKVVCVTTFARKPVKGVAICAEDDEFDLEKGKKLAQARADIKWAGKRLEYARDKAKRIACIHDYFEDLLDDAWRYEGDCEADYYKYADILNTVCDEMIGDGAKI